MISQEEKDIIVAELIAQLPPHWKVVTRDDEKLFWWHSDDGRDYDVPQFSRKDDSDARVYINESEWNTDAMFAIAVGDDGDCRETFEEAIASADSIKKAQLSSED